MDTPNNITGQLPTEIPENTTVITTKSSSPCYRYSTLKQTFNVPDIVTWNDLKKALPKNVNIKRIKLAYNFADKIHAGQKRLSGEDFIHHPLAVAYLIAKLELDEDSIVAALLHDVLEDNTIGIKSNIIKKYFGETVTFLVESLTNIRNVTPRFIGNQDSIPDLRKLLFAAAKDIRVIILRLSDKVHNAWTAYSLPEDKKIRLAKRALTIYAPLAHFVGLTMYRRELEESAFQILYPTTHDWLSTEMSYLYSLNIKSIINPIERILPKNMNIRITARRKSLWSTYQKILKYLERQNRLNETLSLPLSRRLGIYSETLNTIYDKLGVMILTDTTSNVYRILELLHNNFEYLPEQFDDYIKNPKKNGYRGIHTVIKIPQKELSKKHKRDVFAEVQIKTYKMHEFNEYGPASHIAYKWATENDSDYLWIKELVKWTKNKKRYRLKLFDNFVLVLTPQGEIIRLEKGATVIDLFYKLRKEAFPYLVKALVNDKEVPFDYVLKTGDIVSYVIDPLGQIPHKDLAKYAAFKETKNYIKKNLKESVMVGRISIL